jgi:hypothetical protein
MRLAVCVAILGELPALRDNVCAPREKAAQRPVRLTIKQPGQTAAARIAQNAQVEITRS